MTNTTNEFDLVVIGSGPAGYSAALRANQLGGSVAIIEKEQIGGVCLNQGCTPLGAIHTSLEFLTSLGYTDKLGVVIDKTEIHPDLNSILDGARSTAEQMKKGLHFLLEAKKIKIYHGFGQIIEQQRIAVTNPDGSTNLVSAKSVLIATGTNPLIPSNGTEPIPQIKAIDDIIYLEKQPSRIVLLGSPAYAFTYAQLFNQLGTEVTIIEGEDQILRGWDDYLQKRYSQILKKQGIKILLETQIKSFHLAGESVNLSLESPTGPLTIKSDHVFSCLRQPSVKELNLESVGVELKNGYLPIDERGRVNQKIPWLYAAGDVTGTDQANHAYRQGITIAEIVMGKDTSIDLSYAPKVVFTVPEMAMVGKTEEELRATGILYKVGRFQLEALARAVGLRQTEGMVKVLLDEDGAIAGVHMIGARASEAIHYGSTALWLGITGEELGSLPVFHPTMVEAIKEAAADAAGKPLHKI